MSNKTKIIFYTSNKRKFNEIETELKNNNNIILIQDNIDIPEIQSTSNKDVVKHKLQWIINNKMTLDEKMNTSVIVEDTGLYINSLEMNGFPGALVKHYLDHLTTDGICKQNGDSPADAVTYIGLWDCNTQSEVYFKGMVEGKISTVAKGDNGFGYDASFIPLYLNDYDYYKNRNNKDFIRLINNNNYTFAELSDAKKAQCNMRTISAYKLCEYLLKHNI